MAKPLVMMGPRHELDVARIIFQRLLDRTEIGEITLGVIFEGVSPVDLLADMSQQCEVDTLIAFDNLVESALGIKPKILDPVLTLVPWQVTPLKVIALPGLSSRHWENSGYYQYVQKVILETYDMNTSDLIPMLGATLN